MSTLYFAGSHYFICVEINSQFDFSPTSFYRSIALSPYNVIYPFRLYQKSIYICIFIIYDFVKFHIITGGLTLQTCFKINIRKENGMTKKLIAGLLILILFLTSLMTACSSTSTVTETTKTTTETTQTTTQTTKTTVVPTNWWDKFGEPKYGGDLVMRSANMADNFDSYNMQASDAMVLGIYETLLGEDWTVNKDAWPYIRSGAYVTQNYIVGKLAESWELTDPTTLVLNLRQGIHWQDKPPVNGREFTAEDVVYHFNRQMGTGSGFDTPSPYAGGKLNAIKSVEALDKYTVAFHYIKPGMAAFYQIQNQGNFNLIVPRESVEAGLKDWNNMVGTGAWIIDEWVSGSSATVRANPDYWGTDPRYPGNKVPYADTLTYVVIPDTASAISALRTGQIDILTTVPWQQAENIMKTNPDLLSTKVQGSLPNGPMSIDMRVDVEPFNNINVRKALQMAINIPQIAETYYGGNADTEACGLFSPLAYKGVVDTFSQWPKDLQQEYTFNPEKAKQLLDDAGYTPGSDGVRIHTNVVAPSNYDPDILQVMKSYFNDIGVVMDITVMDAPAWRSFVMAKKHDQMATMGFAFTWPPDVVIGAKYSKNTTSNWTNNNDPGYDELVLKFNTAMTEGEAAEIINEANLYYLKAHWSIHAANFYTYTLWQPSLKGYDGEVIGMGQGFYYQYYWKN